MATDQTPTESDSTEDTEREQKRAANRPFANREMARAAAQKSVESRKRKAEQRRLAAAATGSSALDAQHATDAAILRELERKAQAGDVQAAKEVRAWRESASQKAADIPAEALVLARLLAAAPTVRERVRAWLQEEGLLDANGDDVRSTASESADLPEGEATPPSEGVPRSATAGGVPAHTQTGNGLAGASAGEQEAPLHSTG